MAQVTALAACGRGTPDRRAAHRPGRPPGLGQGGERGHRRRPRPAPCGGQDGTEGCRTPQTRTCTLTVLTHYHSLEAAWVTGSLAIGLNSGIPLIKPSLPLSQRSAWPPSAARTVAFLAGHLIGSGGRISQPGVSCNFSCSSPSCVHVRRRRRHQPLVRKCSMIWAGWPAFSGRPAAAKPAERAALGRLSPGFTGVPR
jgi:hypothetical protein